MTRWNFRRLATLYGLFLALLLSWNIPLLYAGWVKVDYACAHAINAIMTSCPLLHHPIAYFNSHSAHWIYDILIFAMLIPYFLHITREERKKRLIFVAFLIAWHAISFYLCHRVLVWKVFDVHRASPSVVIDGYFHLSDVVRWIHVKVTSYQSFPSDHGYTVFSFIFAMYFLRGTKACLMAIFISLLFGFPRLYVGAHWLSDYFIGSFLTALFNFSWIYASPLPDKLPTWILTHVRSLYAKAKRSPQ